MTQKISALILLSLGAILLSIYGCGSEVEPADDAAALALGDSVSSEFLFSAYDIDGTLRSSGDWLGKQPIVLNFWGTWCPPCRKEIPDLVRLYDEFRGKGIEILGLAVRDNAANVAKFSYENGMNWVMLMGDNAMATRYRLTGVPTTIFVNKQGVEIARFIGPRDYETFKAAFQALLQ